MLWLVCSELCRCRVIESWIIWHHSCVALIWMGIGSSLFSKLFMISPEFLYVHYFVLIEN